MQQQKSCSRNFSWYLSCHVSRIRAIFRRLLYSLPPQKLQQHCILGAMLLGVVRKHKHFFHAVHLMPSVFLGKMTSDKKDDF